MVRRCPVLLITGQKSIFNATTRSLHQAILKHCVDKGKVEFIEVAGVANVLEEKVNNMHCLQPLAAGHQSKTQHVCLKFTHFDQVLAISTCRCSSNLSAVGRKLGLRPARELVADMQARC